MQITDFTALNGPAPEAANEADLGRNDFLRMLIAQLENQDPLNPQDSTEFTAQLAQFTSLEKLISIDEGLSTVSESQQGLSGVIEGLASASLIGREALAVGNLFEVGEDGTLVSRPAFSLPEAFDETTLRVFDGDREIATLALGPLAGGFQGLPDDLLDELLSDEDLEGPGVYRFEVTGSAGDRSLTGTPLFLGVVTGAVPLGLEPQVSIGQVVVPYAGIQEIRAAEEKG